MPGHRCGKGGAHRDFGFAEADVAADQAVHRLARSHVVEHFDDDSLLVVGFFIRETVDKARIGLIVDFDHGSGTQRAFGSGFEQFVRNGSNSFLELRFTPLPSLTAQFVERHMFAVGAVARQHVDIFDWDVKLVAAGIAEGHAVMRAIADGDRHQPFVAPDAMFGVDDEVARRQRRQFGEECVGRFPAFLTTNEPVAEHILLANQCDIGCRKAVVYRQHDQRDRILNSKRALPALGFGQGGGAVIREQAFQPFACARRIARDNRLAA